MKQYKTDSEHVENIIQKMIEKDASTTPLSEDMLKELSTDKVTVLAAKLEDNLEYGSRGLIGYAKLSAPVIAEENDIHVETEYIFFSFHIYSDDKIWNEMSNIKTFFPLKKEYIKDNLDKAVDAQILIHETIWGQEGIYRWMETRQLSGDDLDRRLFVKNMQAVSRKYKWGQEVRKLMKNN